MGYDSSKASYLSNFPAPDISINSKPLPSLTALGYVLMGSLFGLEYKEDSTVMLLYNIANEALDHNYTVEILIDIATETK